MTVFRTWTRSSTGPTPTTRTRTTTGSWTGRRSTTWAVPIPLDPDTDGDTLLDGVEVAEGKNPCDPDTDGDCLTDQIDPLPLDPEGAVGQYEAAIHAAADAILALPLQLFVGPNDNARKGKRTGLSNQVRGAAVKLAGGDLTGAIAAIAGAIAKLDGQPAPPDVVVDGSEKDVMHSALEVLHDCLGLL